MQPSQIQASSNQSGVAGKIAALEHPAQKAREPSPKAANAMQPSAQQQVTAQPSSSMGGNQNAQPSSAGGMQAARPSSAGGIQQASARTDAATAPLTPTSAVLFAPLMMDPLWGTSLFNPEPFGMGSSLLALLGGGSSMQQLLAQNPASQLIQREQLPQRLDVDIRETPAGFEIDASCPGVARKDVTLEVDPARHELYIRVSKAGRDEKDESRGDGFVQHVSERWSGNVFRTLRLPRNADFAAIESRLENGVLSIKVRKAAGAAKQARQKVAVA